MRIHHCNWVNSAKQASEVLEWEDSGVAQADTPTVVSQLMDQRAKPVKTREEIEVEVAEFVSQARMDQERAEWEAHVRAREEAKRA